VEKVVSHLTAVRVINQKHFTVWTTNLCQTVRHTFFVTITRLPDKQTKGRNYNIIIGLLVAPFLRYCITTWASYSHAYNCMLSNFTFLCGNSKN